MFNSNISDIYHSDDLLAKIDQISDSEGKSIGLIPFGSVSKIFDKIKQKPFANKSIRALEENKTKVLYELDVYDKKTGALRTSGKFIIYKPVGYKFIYIVITLEEREFFHRELRPFVKSFYNEIILSFIKSKELIDLIEKYKSFNNLTEIKISRASQKIRYHNENSMSTVTWNNSSLEEAYEWLKENNGFFKSIQFKSYRNQSEVATTFFDRRGIIRTDRYFMKVFLSLVQPTLALLDSYIKLFNKRGRRDNKLLESRPIAINFQSDVFSETANHKKFIQSISALSDSSVSVLHGNPYIHLTIIDYIDASSYDLWVLDARKILVVPQLHSSIISLKRLVNHIFDYYAEGEISNYEIEDPANSRN